jgi:polyisoprenoid-binding protein YceI
MSRIILCCAFLIVSFIAVSQKFKPSDAGSKVHFIIKNFGISTGGDISGLTGNINFSPSNISTSSFDVSVNVSTIDTDNEKRDNHLKSEDYFNAEKYPSINIKSSRINKLNKSATGMYYFTGTLTMHGIIKTIAFPFTVNRKGDDYLFVGGFSINRLDYGVGKSSSVLSNGVKVTLSVLAKKS